jgi:hypothetical protein
MYNYSCILSRFAKKGNVLDGGFHTLFQHFSDWSLEDVVILPPAENVDNRLDWSTFPWPSRPSFEALYERLTLRFWEKVVDGIDPVLSQMFPFYAFPAAQKFPQIIDQWWCLSGTGWKRCVATEKQCCIRRRKRLGILV